MFHGVKLTGFSISPQVQKMILVEFVIYSLIIVGLGIWLKIVQRKNKGGSFSDFLTGSGGLNSIEVALLTAMTLMGGGTMISGPGLAYRDGFIFALTNFAYFISNWVCFTVYGKRMAIVGKRIHAQTGVQLIHYRFQSKTVAVIFSLGVALAFTINCGGQLLNAAKLFSTILGADMFYVGLILTGIVIFVYTISGGIKSLAKVSVLQGAIMIVGVLALVGAQYHGIAEKYGTLQAGMEFMARLDSAIVNARNYEPLYFLGMVLLSSWSNTNSLVVLQSTFSFESTKTLKKSLIMSCTIIMLVNLVMEISGPVTHVLNPNITNADYSTIYLTTAGVPAWLSGIVVAAIFATIQSSIASFLLTIAGTMVRDLYKDCINKNATDKQMSKLNYIFLAIVILVSFIIAANKDALGQEILLLANGVAIAMQAMPILIGTFWKRATAGGVVISSVLGMAVYVITMLNSGSQWYKTIFPGVHPILITIVVAAIAMIVGSFMTQNLKVPLGVYKVWFCKEYDEKYTQIYDGLKR